MPAAPADRETGIFLLERLRRPDVPADGVLLLRSVLASGLGIGFGLLVFPAEASLVGVFLVALAQAGVAEALLARNRDAIWDGRESAGRANWRLARSLLVVFLGILLAYSAATLLVPAAALEDQFARQIGDFGGHSLAAVRFGDLAGTLGHNALVLAVGFLCALVYRHGGMLLVLAWNASVWGVVFPYVARTAPDLGAGGPVGYTLLAWVCILPHLLLEAGAYVAAAMAGVFLSKAVQKYRLDSAAFRQVAGAVARIGGAALLLLFLAAAAEAFVAPALVRALFG
jgi:uncharacterized membrane protein SpoIIM required for sporulation